MLLSMLFWAITLKFIGAVFLALSVIFVHKKITDEQRIDGIVLMEMKKERSLAITGIIFITIGYVLEILHYDFLPF